MPHGGCCSARPGSSWVRLDGVPASLRLTRKLRHPREVGDGRTGRRRQGRPLHARLFDRGNPPDRGMYLVFPASGR